MNLRENKLTLDRSIGINMLLMKAFRSLISFILLFNFVGSLLHTSLGGEFSSQGHSSIVESSPLNSTTTFSIEHSCPGTPAPSNSASHDCCHHLPVFLVTKAYLNLDFESDRFKHSDLERYKSRTLEVPLQPPIRLS